METPARLDWPPPSSSSGPAPSSSLDDVADLPGSLVAGARPDTRYRFERPLAQGAQAVVLLATRLRPQGEDPVVLKVFRPSFVRACPALSTLVLRKESVALARLGERVPPTPFVVRMLDQGELLRPSGVLVPWLALEYVHGGAEGGDLAERVLECAQSDGFSFSPARLRRVLGHLVEGLSAMHELGVVHRDLKPQNVLVCGTGDDELAKVSDFGLAQPAGMATTFGAGACLGEPGYAAPEQRHAERVGPWTDVFSLAALTYWMLAAEPMFAGPRPVVLARSFQGQFEPSRTRRAVHPTFRLDGGATLDAIDHVLAGGITRHVARRFPGVRAFHAALDPLLARAASMPLDARKARGSCKQTLASAVRDPWTFQRRHAPSIPFDLRAAACDPDGHALAASREGLHYWEGAAWIPMQAPRGLDPAGIRRFVRLGPARWMAAGARGELTTFTPRAVEKQQKLGADDLELHLLAVASEACFAGVGHGASGRTLLFSLTEGAWKPPLVLERVAITGLVPAPHGDYLVAGSDAAGRGLVWLWRPGDGLSVRSTHARPLRALAAVPGGALALGEDGYAATVGLDGATALVDPRSDRGPRACPAADPAGTVWATASGAVLRRSRVEGTAWQPAWSDTSTSTPFVELAAFSGMVIAIGEDGTVVTGHQAMGGR